MKLQNNFTTIEQGKRLLELGLPANSADCIMKNNKHVYKYNFDIEPTMTQLIERLNIDDYMNVYKPCWSVGRLIEIYELCFVMFDDYNYSPYTTLVERVIEYIEDAIKDNRLDFSKLEEEYDYRKRKSI